MSKIPEHARTEALFRAADERHHRRRRRTARIYRAVDRIFFVCLLALAVLVIARFATSVLPEFLR